MVSPSDRILVIGGNSAIARYLLDLLPQARAIARGSGGVRTTAIADYRRLDTSDFVDVDVVVNCAGIVSGSEVALQRVNVDLQRHLAVAARKAGASRYVAISSFSIFGRRSKIDSASAVNPDDAYGRSKRDADEALQHLRTDGFSPLSVAFPVIVGTTRPGKVEQMLRMWRRLGMWPVPGTDISRSMIGARSAALVLARAAKGDAVGRVLAADPVPFRYDVVARWLREDVGGRFGQIRMPAAGVALLAGLTPNLHRSMMSDSILDPRSNYAVALGLRSSLRQDLADAVRPRDRP